MVEFTENTHLVFETEHASLHQCDERDEFILNFFGETLYFRACEFISFKRKITNLNLDSLFDTDTPDIEIVYLPHCERIMVLSIKEVLELRELLSGTFTMLQLNSLIHKHLIRKTF